MVNDSYPDMERAVINYLAANWSNTTIAYPGQDFDPKDANLTSPNAPDQIWIEPDIRPLPAEGLSGQKSFGPLGDRIYRQWAMLSVMVNAPLGQGKGIVLDLSNQLMNLFSGSEIFDTNNNRILFFAAYPVPVMRSSKNPGWFTGGMMVKLWWDRLL